jgi:N-hydroxyarylamine O-acetyltransferase
MLQAFLPKGWQDMYLFTLEPQHAIDYEVANWFTSTNPTSRFHASLLAERLTPQRRISSSTRR